VNCLIKIRQLQDKDAVNIVKYNEGKDENFFNQWGGGRFYTYPLTAEQVQSRIKNTQNTRYFAITKDDAMIGAAELDFIDWEAKKCSVCRFLLGEEYSNHGYGTEALNLLVDYAMNQLGMTKVTLSVFDFNKNAFRCYEKAGFVTTSISDRPNGWKAIHMERNKNMTLETKRLILRPFVDSDFEAVHSYGSNYENIKFMVWGPNTEDDTRNFIKDCIEKSKKSPQTHFDFVVTLKDSGKVIGGCGIYLNQAGDEGMIGWVLHMDYWKQGYGTEFAAELIRFGFAELNLHRIYATCFSENYGSYRVMERNNMRREAYFVKCRKGRKCDPEPWYDELHYAILKEEWEHNS